MEKRSRFKKIMTKETCLSNKAQRDNREECYVCFRAKKNCLCGVIKPFVTRMRFVILMHSKEDQKQKTGTARLAKMCLKNAELLTGTDFTDNERVNSLIKDPSYIPFVLYPGPETVNFKTLKREGFPEGRTILVFVLDGTWRGARGLMNKSRNIGALPRLSFSGNYRSQFKIKRQPMAQYVSTIEAVYYLCEEAQEAGYERLNGQNETLMTVFKKLVDTQLDYVRGPRKRREQSK